MNEMEKLRILLPHWIEHNEEHAAEFERWAQAAAVGDEEAARLIREAAGQMAQANVALQSALDRLGGPASTGGHGH